MNEDRRKILEMLATGKITADQADQLLHLPHHDGPQVLHLDGIIGHARPQL